MAMIFQSVFWKRFWSVAGLSFISGVAALAVETNTPAWPSAPAEPYVVYVREISGSKDIGARAPFFSRISGVLTGVASEQQQFSRPFGISVDAAGNLIVADTGANAVCYLDLKAKKWQRWTGAGGKIFVSPVAAVRHGKTIFVADSAQGKVIAFDEKSKVQFEITNHLERPTGLALLGDQLVIADAQLHQIVLCSLRGEFISKFGQRGKGPGEFNFPTHVSVDDQKQIYVTDSLNYRVQVFDAAGRFLRTFGSVGDGPGHFSRPKGVAVDQSGHVYVVDAEFANVQIFDERGRLLLNLGEPGQTPGKFWLPNAIAINAKNEIFVADAFNHRVQVLRYTGKP